MSTHKKAETETAASPTDTAEALKLLEQVVAALALPAQVLTTKQRKAAARSRKGMERIVPALATLSVQHGVSVPKQPTSQMTSNLDLVNQLETVSTQLKSLTATVGENLVAARSASWTTATTLYGMLQKPAKRDAQLALQLAPVKAYFAYRTPAAKKEHPKQAGKKAALAAEKETGAQAPVESSAQSGATSPVGPSAGSATASTTAGSTAGSNGTAAHTG